MKLVWLLGATPCRGSAGALRVCELDVKGPVGGRLLARRARLPAPGAADALELAAACQRLCSRRVAHSRRRVAQDEHVGREAPRPRAPHGERDRAAAPEDRAREQLLPGCALACGVPCRGDCAPRPASRGARREARLTPVRVAHRVARRLLPRVRLVVRPARVSQPSPPRLARRPARRGAPLT